MYQQVLRRFAHFNAVQLSDPAPLLELIMLALKEEDMDAETSDNDDLKEKIAEVIFILHWFPHECSLPSVLAVYCSKFIELFEISSD